MIKVQYNPAIISHELGNQHIETQDASAHISLECIESDLAKPHARRSRCGPEALHPADQKSVNTN